MRSSHSAFLTRRSLRILLATFVVYGTLVATHEGEFWPFSIFPMFSQAGQPWTRALARDVTDHDEDIRWKAHGFEDLPADAFAVGAHGVNRLDLSNLLLKTEVWTPDRIEALRSVMRPALGERQLLVLRVRGELVDGPSGRAVAKSFEPYFVLSADTTIRNPALVTRSPR